MEEPRLLTDLLELQELDSDIDRLLERRQALPELEQYRAADEEATAAAAALSDLEKSLRDTELTVDRDDGELQIMEDKVKQTESRLFAGGMNARETENMRRAVVDLRRHIGRFKTGPLVGLVKNGILQEPRYIT